MNKFLFYRAICFAALTLCTLLTAPAFADPYSQPPFLAAAPTPLSKLTHFIQEEMQTQNIVGLSITVVHNQDVVFSRGFGYQNRETRTPASDHTIYRLGSISKVLTATAIMQLVEQGRIDLDAPVTRYLPEFSIRSRFSYPVQITVRQLLTHHAGLPTDLMKGADSLTPDTLKEITDKLKNEFIAQIPGQVFQYSNLGYAVLGRIIETVSQIPYTTYMDENIFHPIHMSRSAFHPAENMKPFLAEGYIHGTPSPPYPVREISAGALYSSTREMAKFIQATFRNGAPLIKSNTQQQMFSKQNNHSPLDLDISMGIGWQLTDQLSEDRNAGVTAWHNGWIWHFSSAMLLLPEHRLGVIVATNSDTGHMSVSRIAQKAVQLLLWETAGVDRIASDTPPARAFLAPHILEKFAGNYDSSSGMITFHPGDGVLEGIKNAQPVILEPLSDGTFRMKRRFNSLVSWQSPDLEGLYFQFVEIDGQIILATLDGNNRIPFAHKVEPVPISHFWSRLAGTYRTKSHIDEFIYIDSISIEVRGQFLTAIVHMKGDHAPGVTLELLLQPNGNKCAIVMGIGRYRGDTLQVQYAGRNRFQLRFQGYTLTRHDPSSVYK